ncbi:MAG: DegV family protein [Firmicutes bacterium]|nr:DegV family protein [Bacillota bacterium]
MAVKILADSTCDLSPELIEKYQIQILPLHVILGDQEFRDGVDITPAQIYEWSDAHQQTPKTSTPSVDEIMDALQPFADGDASDEAILFSISSQMSGCNNIMRMAVRNLKLEDRVHVIDSANLSTGIGLTVIEAAIMAEEGKPASEIVAHVESLLPKVRASFVVDTLTYLHRGGRCSGLTALLGGAFRIHPEIVVEDGAMHPSRKYRGKYDQIILKYAKDLEKDLLNARPDRVFITHSPAEPETVKQVRAYLESLHYFNEILETKAGSVICSHCGPGTLGVLFISK